MPLCVAVEDRVPLVLALLQPVPVRDSVGEGDCEADAVPLRPPVPDFELVGEAV